MGQDFMIADTHFGTDSIRRYENRPFESVQEMDEALIQNWNRVVSEGDTVYVLGDFSSYGKEENKALLKRLKGTKILIMGNHDMGYTPAEWREMGFLECSRWPILYEGFYLLSHEPLYINRNMPYAKFTGMCIIIRAIRTLHPKVCASAWKDCSIARKALKQSGRKWNRNISRV